MDVGLVGLCLGLFGLAFGMFQTWRWGRKFNKYEPLIKRAMSFMGSLGKKTQVDNEVAVEIEDALKGGVFSMLEQKYPELTLVLGWLEENQPEIFEKIADNPQVIVRLYQKYAPLITGVMGAKRESKVMYDV